MQRHVGRRRREHEHLAPRVHAADIPPAAVDGVVRILVDPGAKAGWAELAGHYSYTVNRVIFVTLQTFCGTALVPNQIFVLWCKSTTDGGCCMKSPVVKRSIVLAGHKTSVSLEDEFWRGLKEIAGKRLVTLSTLVDTIDAQRQQGNLSSALRLFVLEFYRSQIPEVEGREGLRDLMDRPKPALS
jgi:predicted DNA-binding ribbon-helix-helix protein